VPPSPQKKPALPLTPLGILAGFTALTEVVVGYALTRVTGGVQIALTAFVIGFPLMLALAFFLILWNRAYVLYPPSEYGNMDPQLFMSAMKSAPLVADQVTLVKSIEDDPNDAEARFSLIDTMADEVECQAVIMMYETGKDIPFGIRYVFWTDGGGGGSGFFGGMAGKDRLQGTGLIAQAGGGRFMKLTKEGKEFAQWLIRRGRKCQFFWTPIATWGALPPGHMVEKWVADAQAQPTIPAAVPMAAQSGPPPVACP